MTVRIVSLALATILVALPGVAWSEEAVCFSTLISGDHSGIRTQLKVVVRTPTDWQTLWKAHTAGLLRPSAMPVIDFTREMLIGVFAGEVPSTARITVTRITRQEKQFVVRYRVGDLQPGPPELGTRTITPFQILRLPRSTLPVVFIPVKSPRLSRLPRGSSANLSPCPFLPEHFLTPVGTLPTHPSHPRMRVRFPFPANPIIDAGFIRREPKPPALPAEACQGNSPATHANL